MYDFIHKPTWTCITKEKDRLISNLSTVLHNVFDKDLINNNNNNNNFIFYFFFLFFHPKIYKKEKFIIIVQTMIGALAARNNLRVKNARQSVERKDI